MNAEERKYRSLITERRRWLLLPTLDRYIFREFMIKLCVLMLVFTIIFVLGDVFDALVSVRVYKDAISPVKALEIMQSESGTHFDPKVAEAFLEISEEFRPKE